MKLMKQGLLTIPEHLGSFQLIVGLMLLNLSFSVCRLILRPFVLFRLHYVIMYTVLIFNILRVPPGESLFIAKQRTEKLSQSVMYCSCMNSSTDGFSPNVDCSWKETMPTCPPLNWGREPCSIRSKRSTDEDDDLTIDVPADIVSYEEGVEGVIFFLMKIQGSYYYKIPTNSTL
jgi:hypothetical protein